MSTERKVILYIAMSLDGFIATKDDDISFLSLVEKKNEDYGYNEFIQTVDTVLIGRKTYDKVLTMVDEFPHNDKQTYVITRESRVSKGFVYFYTGDLKELIMKLKLRKGKNIFCDGGAELVNELLRLDLIDEFYISIIPILLGSGIPLFNKNRSETNLKLVENKHFEKGLVQLHYVKY